VRRLQRIALVDELKLEYQEISRPQAFHDLVRETLSTETAYVDPYAYIGDSFIGLHFNDTLLSRLGLPRNRVFSLNAHHRRR